MNLWNSAGDSNGFSLSPGISLPAGAVTLGIRPENLHISQDGRTEAFRADARVGAVELVGAESYVHAWLSNGQPIVFRVPGRPRIAIDEHVSVSAAAESLHLFDDGGRRMTW